MPSQKQSADTRRHYGTTSVDMLYARVWGESIHFGIYPSADYDMEAATFETKRQMAGIVGIATGARVLEVASGWGASARYLACSYGASVVATNFEPAHQAHAEVLRDLTGLKSAIELNIADFHKLPFPDNAFDVWWCQEAVVHATDKHKLFSEALRVLAPGGRIVFSDQTTDRNRCTDDELRKVADRHGCDDLYSAKQFASALSTIGFADIVTHTWDPHMARHFANLVERIDRTRDVLCESIDPVVVLSNEINWRFAADLAAAGKIGWSCFCARKP